MGESGLQGDRNTVVGEVFLICCVHVKHSKNRSTLKLESECIGMRLQTIDSARI